jgi:hypothetical protein
MRVKVRADFKNRITDGRLHQGLSALEEYFVIGIDSTDYRLIDDGGEPILYPKELFEVLDPSLPAGWKFREFEEGEYNLDPVRVAAPGFYEDFFGSDGDKVAEANAHQILRKVLESTLTTVADEDKRLIERDLARMAAYVATR